MHGDWWRLSSAPASVCPRATPRAIRGLPRVITLHRTNGSHSRLIPLFAAGIDLGLSLGPFMIWNDRVAIHWGLFELTKPQVLCDDFGFAFSEASILI